MEEATALVNARALFTLPCYESVLVFRLCRALAAFVCVCGFFPTPLMECLKDLLWRSLLTAA